VNCPFGYRILGATSEARRVVLATAALIGHATCDARAQNHLEAYLSAFQYGSDFRDQLQSTSSTAGFKGPCWASFVWFDIDREHDLPQALTDARRLSAQLLERYLSSEDQLWIFFSGSKGFHLGLSTDLWRPAASDNFNRIAKRFCQQVADRAGIAIDEGVYDKVRAFRAPNSRHPKTGLHKRPMTYEELHGLTLERIVALAAHPQPCELPTCETTNATAIADWQAAEATIASQTAEASKRKELQAVPTLNRSTLEFIKHGASAGDRHRLLFSAAANLGEFGCPYSLAAALLTEPARDSGLTPSDVKRQIECGLNHKG